MLAALLALVTASAAAAIDDYCGRMSASEIAPQAECGIGSGSKPSWRRNRQENIVNFSIDPARPRHRAGQAIRVSDNLRSKTDVPDQYLRGYLQALLDSHFPGFGVSVKALASPQVTLAARTCLGPAQKRDIERLLAQSGHGHTVAWDSSTDCEGPAPATDVTFEILPERELFAPLIADPRQPRFSMSYQRYKTPSQSFNAASVALGEYFGIASGFLGESGASQIGIQAAVFALFNLDAPSSDLINADYWLGIPLSYRKGPWSYLLRLYHQSSHLGDEFILGNPGVNRVNMSYEDLELLASYEWERLRFYGGGGYLLHSEPDLAPKHVQAGMEYTHARAAGTLDFIAAADIRASEELDWRRSRAYQAGFELRSASQRRARLMLEHFRGHSPNGQFYRDPLRYTGLGLYFGF